MRTSAKINDLKNYSLYASQIAQDYFKPSELIDNQTATAYLARSRELLQIYGEEIIQAEIVRLERPHQFLRKGGNHACIQEQAYHIDP